MISLTGQTRWRSVLGIFLAAGAMLSLLSIGIGVSAITAVGDLMATIGFLTGDVAGLTHRVSARGATDISLPRWAATVLIIGGPGFAAGFIASGFIVLVR